MIEKESCVRSSRLIPLADDIYCLVFSASLTLSPPVTLLVMQFIKVKKFGRICFRFFLFPLIDCFPATFQFYFISMPILMLRTLRTETEKNAMWQHKNIHHAASHVQKYTWQLYCLVLFGLVTVVAVAVLDCILRVYTQTLNHLLQDEKKFRASERKKKST